MDKRVDVRIIPMERQGVLSVTTLVVISWLIQKLMSKIQREFSENAVNR